jgi:heme-degrading monooxygenase HmoA
MTEVELMYDLRPGTDLQAYQEWAKKAIGTVLSSPGIVEFRANRNVLGSPNIRSTTVWKSLADWGNFTESDQWTQMEMELRTKFAQDIQVHIWGPSPIVPEPLRP